MYNLDYIKNIKLNYSYSDLLKKIIKENDNDIYIHSQRLKEPAYRLGKIFEFNSSEIKDLLLLAELHDVGKIIIRKSILNKDDSLDSKEWQKIREHPLAGFQIAYNSFTLMNVAEGILTHHEWWNGKGYPLGLKKEEIPLMARIISVVDAYDVMKYGRKYKKAMSKKKIIEELKKSSGVQFDPLVVRKFVNLISTK
ncbi:MULTISPECIES: HD-GYP domain-containing protein [unclassified Halanaerobium]|uniref:HD-GYP domain-containing protein n=1 Tax=unclassified Halanaerobium TaxID=2641197 RepID=UPI000DF25F5F|nr:MULTISPECIES: HD domain-containing phosphohydrolase [unclassified Halanaerobium]RCW50777.1 HD domain-containing protein [Halanaerobium sp. MA284_MarDTE_T2]RCW84967.1 metal dependent phosphohydrolase [Halanaerobium sp. DL-01]